jgi:hypothetical protein
MQTSSQVSSIEVDQHKQSAGLRTVLPSDVLCVHKVKWVKLKMYTYKPNCILTLREEEGLPVFGEII